MMMGILSNLLSPTWRKRNGLDYAYLKKTAKEVKRRYDNNKRKRPRK